MQVPKIRPNKNCYFKKLTSNFNPNCTTFTITDDDVIEITTRHIQTLVKHIVEERKTGILFEIQFSYAAMYGKVRPL